MSNPYHKPAGSPQGGEFTSGPSNTHRHDSAKAKATENAHDPGKFSSMATDAPEEKIRIITTGSAVPPPPVANAFDKFSTMQNNFEPIPGGEELYKKLHARARQVNPNHSSGWDPKSLKDWSDI